MKTILIIAALSGLLSLYIVNQSQAYKAATEQDLDQIYMDYIADFRKSYISQEEFTK